MGATEPFNTRIFTIATSKIISEASGAFQLLLIKEMLRTGVPKSCATIVARKKYRFTFVLSAQKIS